MKRFAAVDHPPESGAALDRAPDAAAQSHPDELTTEIEVRAKLLEFLSHLPRGAKKPFARLCGYRGKWALHTLRGVAKGRAMLPEACRKRVSRVLNELFRREWVLVDTGMLTSAGRPSHTWRRHESLSAQHRHVAIDSENRLQRTRSPPATLRLATGVVLATQQ